MLARIRKAQDNHEGFTLIELLVVMIIIGILAAIAIPAFLSQKSKAYEAGMKSDLRSIATEIQTQLVDQPTTITIGGGAADGANVTVTPSGGGAAGTINVSAFNSTKTPLKNVVNAVTGVFCVDLVNSKSNTTYRVSVIATGATQVIASGPCP